MTLSIIAQNWEVFGDYLKNYWHDLDDVDLEITGRSMEDAIEHLQKKYSQTRATIEGKLLEIFTEDEDGYGEEE